jgi:hypothetical protein
MNCTFSGDNINNTCRFENPNETVIFSNPTTVYITKYGNFFVGEEIDKTISFYLMCNLQ